MSRPAVPLARTVRLGLAVAGSSRSVLAASLAWFALLAAVYAADAGPPLAALAFTAAALTPIAAWAAAASLAATSPDLRQLLTAANGHPRVLLADAVPSVLWVLGATVAGSAAPWLLDPHPAPWTDRLLGAVFHLLCGCVGIAIALALHAAGVTRGVQTLVVAAGSLASARVAWLPPAGPVLSLWGAGERPGWGAGGWALLGPFVVASGLLVVTLRFRRRR